MEINRQGTKSLSIIGRLSTLRSVHYQRFQGIMKTYSWMLLLNDSVYGSLLLAPLPPPPSYVGSVCFITSSPPPPPSPSQAQRLHEKKEHSTSDQVMDPKTRLMLFKMVDNQVLTEINGCVSTGKEACVFHAGGGRYILHQGFRGIALILSIAQRFSLPPRSYRIIGSLYIRS